MKKGLKKLFLLGLAAGAAGVAVKHKKKIREAIKDLVQRKKLSKTDGDKLTVEIYSEIEKVKKPKKKVAKKKHAKKATKKRVTKKPVRKKKPVKKARRR